MKKTSFALLRTFMFVTLVPMLSLNLVSCEPADGVEDVPSVVDPDEEDESESKEETDGDASDASGEGAEAEDPTSAVAVDLGLSVKWASCNVGATSPEDYGDYFAWGETTTKSNYSSSISVTYGLSTSTLKSRGIIDADGNLTAAYDAATANWGDNWRMPTKAEQDELRTECTWKWTTQNGVYGRKVTGSNGNSIFLPAAGVRRDASLNSAGSDGYYWSATPYSHSSSAYDFYFTSFNYDWNFNYRGHGQVVRPVSE